MSKTVCNLACTMAVAVLLFGCATCKPGGDKGAAGATAGSTTEDKAAPAEPAKDPAAKKEATPKEPGASSLAGPRWELVALGDVKDPRGMKDNILFLQMKDEDKGISGFAGCNRLMGSYKVEGGKLTFEKLGMTRRMCPPKDIMQQEARFMMALGKVKHFALDGGALELLDENRKQLARFVAGSEPATKTDGDSSCTETKRCQACLNRPKGACSWTPGVGCKKGCNRGEKHCMYADPDRAKAFCLRARCAAHTTCEPCLKEAGCNWTGGRCSDRCLMDTSCFGPGNKRAPACPKAE